jgi:hypothetical protein
MGMVFNTTHTKNLLHIANSAFDAAHFLGRAADATLMANLQNLGATTTIYPDVWNYLGLGHDGVPRRLEFWLNLLDFGYQAGNSVSFWIGQYILSALNSPNRYSAIEFFAVAGSNQQVAVKAPQDIVDPHHAGKFIMAITIDTDLVDNFPGHPHHGT